jgi:acyl carrier protein
VARLVRQIAPELGVESIDYSLALHELADIDSLDFLALVALTSEVAGVVIPPRDYLRLATLDGFAGYLVEQRARLSPPETGTPSRE